MKRIKVGTVLMSKVLKTGKDGTIFIDVKEAKNGMQYATIETRYIDHPDDNSVVVVSLDTFRMMMKAGIECLAWVDKLNQRSTPTPRTTQDIELHCEACGGFVQVMGTLGNMVHGRCRQCGMEVHAPIDEANTITPEA